MRNFTWCRQEVAEDCRWGGTHVHIVITSPGARRIMPSCRNITLRLFFYDLDPEAIRRTNVYADNPAKGRELIDGCFTEEQAVQLVSFVKGTDPDETVIVNCEAGISRSPGVVLALRRFQKEETESLFRKGVPNIHVASVLGRVLGVGPFQARKYKGIVLPFDDSPNASGLPQEEKS